MKRLRKATSSCYAMKNTITNKIYVGVSVDLEQRIYTHMLMLRNGTHTNKVMQRDFDRHGESFEYYEMECDIPFEDRSKKEVEWIIKLESYLPEKGYNLNDTRVEKTLNGPDFPIIQGIPDIG